MDGVHFFAAFRVERAAESRASETDFDRTFAFDETLIARWRRFGMLAKARSSVLVERAQKALDPGFRRDDEDGLDRDEETFSAMGRLSPLLGDVLRV
jgi:hypothetical protein